MRRGFLQESLLASVPMSPGSPASTDEPVLGSALTEAIDQRYDESGAEGYGIPMVQFGISLRRPSCDMLRTRTRPNRFKWWYRCILRNWPWHVHVRQGTRPPGRHFWRGSDPRCMRRPIGSLATMPLAANWQTDSMRSCPVCRIGTVRRVSKLDYYMGRGSLEGWLRTVLSQQYIDRHRSQSREVSLEQQIEAGVSFADRTPAPTAQPDRRMAAAVSQELAALGDEERFLLASYYLDERTLANIGRQLRVHESTISRRLERLTGELRKRVRKRLEAAGVDRGRCEELLQEFDVRDLNVDVAANLRQETSPGTFHE